jgi:hypothetical protein
VYATGQTSERREGAGTWKWSESFVMAINGLGCGMSASSFQILADAAIECPSSFSYFTSSSNVMKEAR